MIGELLKLERLAAGISQKALSQKSGISYVAINRIENGQPPRVSIVTKLFEALGKKLIFSTKPLVDDQQNQESN
jgi:transcriptional regulator with XRE-family HTH domain